MSQSVKRPDGDSVKICMYIGSMQKGGAERVMGNLAEYFCREGWEVVLVTTYFRPPEYELADGLWDQETGEPFPGRTDGIRRIYAEPPAALLAGNRLQNFHTRCRYLREIWQREKPDLILSFLNSCNNMALYTTRGMHIPVVVSVRAVPALEYATRKTRIPAFCLFRRAAGVVLQTREAASFFPKKVQERAVVLPNSVNPAFMRKPYAGRREKTVVSVGRIDENKNQAMLIRAFAAVRDRHPEYTLHLYGTGPAMEDCRKLAAELVPDDGSGQGAVIFHGTVSDVPEQIEKAGIFVLTSRTEGMPNALIEAMSLGLPCISTDCPCGGPRELIGDGKNGLLIPVDDEKALEEKLLVLMEDEDLAGRLGREAAKVQDLLSPEKVNAAWKTYLLSVIEKSRTS